MTIGNDTTDADIVRLTLENPENFRSIIERYEWPLRRYIHRLTEIDEADADDVLQEIFIKVYRHLYGYDADISFSSWIYRIAHNHTIDLFRKRKTENQFSLDDADIALLVETLSDGENPSTEMSRQDIEEAMTSVFQKMKKEYREILILHFLETRSYDEISDILEIPIGTVGTLIHRAKAEMRQLCIDIHCNFSPYDARK